MSRRVRLPPSAPEGLSITRDDAGVPHITAADLGGAHWGMGYGHALDRGLQMLLMRILGQGRAAECLDGSDETLEIDRFFRRMNWAGGVQPQIERLTAITKALVEEYCAGVNARLRERGPWELRLLGYRPEPWTPGDCVLISRMVGYVTLAQSQAEAERFFVELVQAGIADDKLEALFPGSTRSLDRAAVERIRLTERIVPASLRWLSGAPRAMASNNWVVSGERTASGAAMLSNDPHLEVNRLPNVWCEQAVRHGDDYALAMTMPGLPAPLVGRSRRLAWGATYTFMDGVDSWMEECRDGERRVGDAWVALSARTEVVRRKGGEPVEWTFYESEHGVLDGDPGVPGLYLSTRWAPGSSGAESLEAAAAMWKAESVEAGRAALGRIETAWNWVLADADGHIGYQMSGLMPLRHEHDNGFGPLPGWDAAHDWQGFVPPEQLPRALDPDEGLLVTANQDLNHLGEADPINLPMGDYRARRIADLLAERDDHDRASFATIQMDLYSIQADELLAVLLPLAPDSPAATELREWDRRYDVESTAAARFEAFYEALLRGLLGPVVGAAVTDHLVDGTGMFIDFYQNVDRILLDPASPWFAGRSRDALFVEAFEVASAAPARAWGESNRVTLSHILLGGKLPSWAGFDRGPGPLPGGRATPHQGQVYVSGGRATSFAPSMRLVADLGEESLWTALAGGPSDRRFSRWYTSGLEAWRRGELKELKP